MINLSKHKFTEDEFKVLGYNFNFIPTPKKSNTEQLMGDISQFGRKIKLRAHFGNQPKNDQTNFFKPVTYKTWTPQAHHTINTFLEAFQNDIKLDLESNKTDGPKNLSKHELTAIKTFKNRTDIIMINADEGRAVTILNLKPI